MNRISVLVVDDHEVVREGLRALLARTPTLAVLGEAGTAADAVALARRHRPDVMLLDLRLPDRSGVEVCREIRADVPETRVLMLTSYADDEAVFASIVAGAAGYLLKQVRGHDLVRAIEAVAAGQSLLDPTVTPSVLAKMKALAAGGPRDELTGLSAQEERVLELVAAGRTNKEIAATLGLSDKTVKNYLSRVFEKLHLTRRAEAAALFTRRQVLQTERLEGRSPATR
jgi:DNA-binding NarL/FixJ family response regulator